MKTSHLAATLLATLAGACATSEIRVSEPMPMMQEQGGDEPSMDEMMAAWMKAGMPGEQHRALDPFVGNWNATVKMWMDPAAPPQESKGKMTSAWILGDRYLEQKYEGEFMGQPFTGLSIMGYDNAGEAYIGMWIDSMSTAMSISKGQLSGKTFTFQATCTDPMTGQPSTCKETLVIDGPDKHTMAMYEQRGDEQVKTMEIVYERAR